MPKKTAVNPLEFQSAVAMFGEPAIKALARTPQTFSTWKARNAVPADVVLPLILELWKQRGGMVREQLRYESPPPGVDPQAWPAIRALLPRLSRIYESQDLMRHSKRWGWITGNIETFSDIVKDDVDKLREEKRKARDAG